MTVLTPPNLAATFSALSPAATLCRKRLPDALAGAAVTLDLRGVVAGQAFADEVVWQVLIERVASSLRVTVVNPVTRGHFQASAALWGVGDRLTFD